MNVGNANWRGWMDEGELRAGRMDTGVNEQRGDNL